MKHHEVLHFRNLLLVSAQINRGVFPFEVINASPILSYTILPESDTEQQRRKLLRGNTVEMIGLRFPSLNKTFHFYHWF
ncbi:MAG: hypothetical protein ACPGED_09940, partial [Flavobacteriales bacterium]